MKKILYCLFIALLFGINSYSQSSQLEIGVCNEEGYTLTIDIDRLKGILQKELERNEINADLKMFRIKKDTMESKESEGKEYYILIANNDDEDVKIGVELRLNENNVFVAEFVDAIDSFSSTCTCSGSCTRGCDPKLDIDRDNTIVWICSSCKQSGKTCNKSVTKNL